MNYEEKYKNALRWIESIYPTLQSEQRMEAEGIFPELAESEDERTRKELLDYLHTRQVVEGLTDTKVKRYWIAWLEKQGEKKPVWSEEDRTMAFTLMRDIDQMSYVSKEGRYERIGWLTSLDEKFASTESAWSEEDEILHNQKE